MPAPTHIAGSDSRPVFSVVSAIFRPWPSRPITFSAGTNTSWNRVTLFSRPRRPMNALRRSIVMPSRVGLDDERGDAAAVPLGLRHLRHHHEQRGDRAVGGPQLHAVEPVAAVDRRRRGGQPGRVGADVGLGQQERGDLTGGQPGQELLLLLVGAEELQRLRYADRLVRRQQRAERRVDRADQRQRLAVVQVGQAEAAVLLVDLHAERAELGEAAGTPRRGSARRARSAAPSIGLERTPAACRGTPRPSAIFSGSGVGHGSIRSIRSRPRNSSLPKLGLRQSASRAASATCRACFSSTVAPRRRRSSGRVERRHITGRDPRRRHSRYPVCDSRCRRADRRSPALPGAVRVASNSIRAALYAVRAIIRARMISLSAPAPRRPPSGWHPAARTRNRRPRSRHRTARRSRRSRGRAHPRQTWWVRVPPAHAIVPAHRAVPVERAGQRARLEHRRDVVVDPLRRAADEHRPEPRRRRPEQQILGLARLAEQPDVGRPLLLVVVRGDRLAERRSDAAPRPPSASDAIRMLRGEVPGDHGAPVVPDDVAVSDVERVQDRDASATHSPIAYASTSDGRAPGE